MNQAEKIQTQLANLSKAQLAMLNQQPPDLDGYQRLADVISGLQYQLLSMSSVTIPALEPNEVKNLQVAVDELTEAINSSRGATAILNAATALAQS